MRRRGSFGWALAGSLGLAFLLVLACHGGFAVSAASGMSAPPAPAPLSAQAPATQFLQSQFDWHGCILRALRFEVTLAATGTIDAARRPAGTLAPRYGPLYSRPPPSFS